MQRRTFGVAVDGVFAIALGDAAVDAFEWEAAQAQEVLQHVQHYLELAEYQHLTRSTALEYQYHANPVTPVARMTMIASFRAQEGAEAEVLFSTMTNNGKQQCSDESRARPPQK